MTQHAGKGWRLAPSLVALEAEVDRLAPNRSTRSDGTIGDQAHRQRRSDHNPSGGWVHALDITDDARHGVDISAILRDIAARRDHRVEYLISDGEIWERQTGRWRRYTGSNPHRAHGHISVRHTAKARNDVSPWLTTTTVRPSPKPTPTPPPAPKPPPLPPTEEDDMRIIQHTSGAARLSHGGLLFDLTADSYRYYREDRGVEVDICNQAAWDMEHVCHADGNALKRELES